MKKLLALLLTGTLVLSLAACGNSADNDEAQGSAADTEETGDSKETDVEETPDFVTITSLNGEGEAIEQEIPYDPERLAVMDLAVLDILDNFDLGDKITGVSKGSSIDYLQDYVNDDAIINLGTIKEADLEAVMECEPDVIFIGGRLSAMYEEFAEIAPVVYLATDSEKGVVESTADNAMTIASIFGVEDKAAGVMAEYDERIEALAEVAEGNSAVVAMVNNGGLGVLGNDGRCSIIGVEIGFENIGLEEAAASGRGGSNKEGESGRGGSDEEGAGRGKSDSEQSGGSTATHGNEASFEVLVSLNADYVFIMDRDAAIGTDGAQLAQEVMENELVMKTDAYQNDNIVYLEHSNVWYTAEGGITALGVMLSDLEAALLD